MSLEPNVEEDFNDFWKDIVCKDDVWDLDQVKRELADYHSLLQEVPKVYYEITDGIISKPNTIASDVLAVHSERCPLALPDEDES